MPYAVPAVVATLMWGYLYGADFGPIAQIARAVGFGTPDFLSPENILGSMMNIVTWEFVGYNMIIMYAALRSIPAELYEAAEIDGAGQFRLAWSVKIPAIRPAIMLTVIFSIIGSFQLFAEPSLLNAIAPTRSRTPSHPNYYAYNLAFINQELNYAAAIAFLLGLVIAVVSYFVQLGSERSARRERKGTVMTSHRDPHPRPLRGKGKRRRGEAHYDPSRRRSRLLTVLLWLCVLYFILPLWWLFVVIDERQLGAVLHVRPVVRR